MTSAVSLNRARQRRQPAPGELLKTWPCLAPRDVVDRLLWQLYCLASEASRRDTFLIDGEAVRLYRALEHDYGERFGKADASQPMRARLFDAAIRPWLLAHEGGMVVELGCGLETRFERCDDGDVRWLCVDAPEALAIRESLLPSSSPRCRYLRADPLDLSWMSQVDPRKGLFVSAQGLAGGCDEVALRRLIATTCQRFPGVELMFDVTPRWLSGRTLRSFSAGREYSPPHTPWGLNCEEVESVVRAWSPRIRDVAVVPYGARRGLRGLLLTLWGRIPRLRNLLPSVIHVRSSEMALR
jgi:hypothetical protein